MLVFRGEGKAGERVLALGTFDGVHRGHRALLLRAKAFADSVGCPLRVYTFDRHPTDVIAPGRAPKLLTTLPEKLERMVRLGVDEVQVVPFTRETAETPPETFLRRLREQADVRAVAAGWNYTFGKNARGNADTLLEDGERGGYEVLIQDAVTWRGQTVSSSRIREALKQGDTETANDLLFAPYTLKGTVVREEGTDGNARTAVLRPAKDKLLPAAGEYRCMLRTRGLYGIADLRISPSGAVTVRLRNEDGIPGLTGEKIRLTL